VEVLLSKPVDPAGFRHFARFAQFWGTAVSY